MNANNLKLTVLLTSLTVLFVIIGNALGGTTGMIIAVGFALLLNGAAYWFSDKMILKMSGAREVSAQEEPELHHMVAVLAERAKLPMPKVYVMDTSTPNAFATGRDPQHGVVAVTTGIRQALTRDELAGVIAHELAHIKHRDTLLSAIVATVAGAITMIAEMSFWSSLFGGGEEEEGGGLAGGLVMLIVAPMAAMLIQMGISRAREFQADEGGAAILGDALPLASALEKIERAAQYGAPMQANPGTASLYIINPLSGGGASGLLKLFSTHPPTDQRIERLRVLAYTGRYSQAVAF